MKKLYSIFITFLFINLFVSCNTSKLQKKEITITRQDNTNISLIAELAKTDQERQKGYMERTKIPEGTGMLFIFQEEQILTFWMKNTPTPLSIAYIDSHGKIRDIFDMKPYDLSSIYSSVSVKYALEVPQGWFNKNNIQIGDTLNLEELGL